MALKSASATRSRSPSPSHSSTSSSSAQPPPLPQQGPKDTPKIPPPPSEHPPPYTPFGGQSSSLLPQPQGSGSQARGNRRVVDPPGFRKYLRHLTARNLLLFVAILLGILLFVLLIHKMNQSDVELHEGKALEEQHRPLAISHRGLGAVKGKRDRISFDKAQDMVVLSEFSPEEGMLRSELITVGEHLEGFRQLKLDLNRLLSEEADQEGREKQLPFDECMQFTALLACCSTPSQSKEHLSKCLLQTRAQNFTSVASMFDFLPQWQSLHGEDVLLVHNRQRQAVLDLRKNILHEIDEAKLPDGYISQGFHFTRNTPDELAQLVRSGEAFQLCEYVRTQQVDQQHGNYALKNPNCRQTPFKVEFELAHVLFCVNSLYTAVLQFGHLQGESAQLTWRLRVKFDSSPTLYSVEDSVHGRQEQMAMDCGDERIDLFMLGDHELHQFWATLPTPRNGHFADGSRKL